MDPSSNREFGPIGRRRCYPAHVRFLPILLPACWLLCCGGSSPAPDPTSSAPVQFRTHVIEAEIPGGYAVMVTDINRDGRPDVVGMTSRIRDVPWYENPSWGRHALVEDFGGLVNMAAHDIDGDGIPEIAIENEFSMVAAKSRGLVWLLKAGDDVREPWRPIPVDELTTSHHLVWADVDGDGTKELVNGPLIGEDALAPKYEDNVPLVYYHVPDNLEGEWERLLIDDQLRGVLHRVRAVQWDDDPGEELLTAGFDGITLHDPAGKGDEVRWENTRLSRGHKELPKTAGSSDVAVGSLNGNRILTSVEPWHGNEVVVYTPDGSGGWTRQVIFEQLTEGHEVCVGDFNGDGRDDIVAGDRARGEIATSHVFYSQDDQGAEWIHNELDPLGMSASGCATADINGDGRIDIVQIGGATRNIKWYENLGQSPSP